MTIQHAQTSERTLALPDVTQASLEAPAPLFQLDQVGFAVAGRALLEPLTLSLPARSVVGLIGHNGSGKSTLLKLLSRQQPSSSGTIRFEGRALRAWSDRDYARKVAYLPQQTPPAAGMLVKELVALGRYPWHGALGRFGDIDREKVANAMALTHIEPFADRLVDTLSGGERQRAWIAMLVAQDAECLLLDEPTSALDIAHQIEVLSLVRQLARERNLGVVVVLHDVNMAARFCDEIIALHSGKLIARGTPDKIMTPAELETIYGIPMGVMPSPDHGHLISFAR
ncbi:MULTISPECIES: ATP-binding cassette domain-containing protein [Bradyrhizobium]|uniref:ATP-binding cassette domain-containing protein n=1 Tax=Bradyrhizobium TaxID=374 RepID=UPI0004AF4C6E|nr:MULTISPECIES: ATP-binding cassette domain-containing protein [Bradyrhizobium]MCA1372774.1 ATP-binding cassette domain-containing protein [Bradyrhizobium sp. IC4060]MCA1413752.1 ATP-binding cassette domain-containing protein [Bradyrhizobium sp. NBAIM20]MCA1460443.1 ATP-binding cassette domain-containing protein [Bradyrhizobium sp. NBAIM18]MCA1466366.1 ATP-binding cassette domain-containing protein [Bradyrhizobium sp. IC3195]MCA1475395.1 ATP-binding cassette domain-containing protein [Bradyrh